MLRQIGWRDADIDQNAAEHLSITFSGGPRLDLFVYPQGSPVRSAPMHPHIALTVSPGRFLEWKRRLESRGVVVAGPTRPGLPGQASFYFNDPFGNHLELVALGFVAFDLPVGVPDRSRLYYRWSGESAAA
jgi:catechol 2,3-dioxygenase-like lactoylglutathione lyase family enzyme